MIVGVWSGWIGLQPVAGAQEPGCRFEFVWLRPGNRLPADPRARSLREAAAGRRWDAGRL
jgi:hypothetical protein